MGLLYTRSEVAGGNWAFNFNGVLGSKNVTWKSGDQNQAH